MRRLPFLTALFFLLTMTDCAIDGPYVAPTGPPPPEYLYTYEDGACWADGVLYRPCPWYAGGYYGYYHRFGGVYYWDSHVRWPYRPGAPPPRVWVAPPVPHPHVPMPAPRYIPPPRYVPPPRAPAPRGWHR